MTSLEERYKKLCTQPSDIVLHLPRFVQLCLNVTAQHVIELGSRSGVSTVAWLYGLEQTGGRLTSIDLAAAPEIGTWPHWTHIQGNDLDEAIIGKLDPADIVFIDTSHAYEQTCTELATYRHLVNPGGVIACHDTMLRFPEDAPPSDPDFPVRRAIERFVKEHDLQWVNIPECYGLGLIKV